MASHPVSIHIDGKEYVLIPRREYLRLAGEPSRPTLKDARSVVRTSVGASLRKARETARLTQAQLAKRLKVSQPMVSAAESGKERVAERYVARVLKACKLPADWTG